MITTVTLNPCIDLTVHVPALHTGELNLVTKTRTDACGKGVNVSLVLRELGLATVCTGITFDSNGQLLAERLEEHSVAQRFVVAHGQIRTNIKLYDDAAGTMTEINQTGSPVPELVLNQYFQRLRECAAQSDLVVFSGRIPAGASKEIYRQSLKEIRHLPCRTLVDAEGEPLRRALLQKPYLIKPNISELSGLVRQPLTTREEVVGAACKLVSKGVGVVCVSMGGDGALITDGVRAYGARSLEVKPLGFQGAGDSMVAGICKGIKEGGDIDLMLRYGVAAATASIIREGTLLCRRADFQKFLPLVKLEELPVPQIEAVSQRKNRSKARKSQ